ncbi:class E sortase [Streptomyces litchfieldiae]|uniref:Class E sortase n=1 Tax=Streptomyces litchfieldiae TaxID=3075543 RepID=A0ABU2MMG1_9ACTN|nr:class E sortase [Streptomyces sp. DSM 44938]MDT0342128.1 class E sortase [Streptomyces sp. DSM 44938]
MTGERPGGGAWGSEGDAYAEPDAFQAAVESLNDPLSDPLPGHYPEQPGNGAGYYAAEYPQAPGGPDPYQQAYDPETVGLRRPADLNAQQWSAPYAPGRDFAAAPDPNPGPATPPPTPGGRAARRRAAAAQGEPGMDPAATQAREIETPPPAPGGRAARRRAAQNGAPAESPAAAPAAGGRAARRRAAQNGATATESPAAAPAASGRAARRRAAQSGSAAAESPGGGADEAELSGGRAARRKAAKAAAKAAKQTGTAISNVIGELFITTGVLLLLFVVYQLWWTNVEARAHANGEADRLTEQWDEAGGEDRDPGTFSPGQGFAILYLPTLDVRVPIAESVDPSSVLDNGMVGHYTEEDRLPTAMPWDPEGNFGLAGHRNTHGEPFRYINQLNPGDPIVVETQDAFYTYEMTSRLDSTSPSNTDVLDPVPTQGGFTEPGRYITLTTCTPEFTSTYRLIVWGQMVEERPRSEGKPDALVN